jgi:hypothetical protein
MAGQLLNLPPDADLMPLVTGFMDDFDHIVTADRFTTLVADTTATAVVGDAAGGILTLFTDATDNNEVAVRSTKELWKIVDAKPIEFRCRLQYSEANTDDANVMCGLMDAVGANAMVDNGAGPKTSYSGAVLYKVDGGTKWVFQTSLAATQTSTTTETTAGGSSYHAIRIVINPISSTVAEAIPYIDTAGGNCPQQMRDANGVPIRHTITYASATEMNCFVYAKAGSANAESVLVDYLGAYQKR